MTEFTRSSPEYLTYMKHHIFSGCANKSVIELGPFSGWHTDLILSHNPTSVTLVDANPDVIEEMHRLYSSHQIDVTVIHSDVHQFYAEQHKSDIVVCCGVLYHLHSPLHLLEQIVNRSDPDTVILDSAPTVNTPVVTPEPDNVPGNRYTNNWKSCMLNLILHYNDICTAMTNLGYYVSFVDHDLERFRVDSKRGWVAVFNKVTYGN